MALEVVLDAVVVEQRVVDVDQEDDGGGGQDAAAMEALDASRGAWVRARNDGKADAGQHLLGETPPPVALRAPGLVHPRLLAEIEHIL